MKRFSSTNTLWWWRASALDAAPVRIWSGFAHVILLANHNEMLAKYEVFSGQLRSAVTNTHRSALSGIPADCQSAEVWNNQEVDANAIARKVEALHG
jgi:hypothetical protein